MGREFELKYRATPQVHQAILNTCGPFRTIAMETTYFDTPDSQLSVRKMTLRLRRENQQMICTLKTPLAQGGRGEWECEAAEIHQGVARLIAMGAPAEVAQLTTGGLIPVCGARFTRMATTVATEDGTAELALDQGILLGGDRQMDLCELEVELKTGSDQATIALAQQLAALYGLQPEQKSKFRRALSLAQGENYG